MFYPSRVGDFLNDIDDWIIKPEVQ
jgi:hypothetical protein